MSRYRIRALLRRLLPALVILLVCAPSASAQVQHLSYRFGPVTIQPGQNSIYFDSNDLKPRVDGYILSFTPNLTRLDGSVPPVDQLHLHHGVWLSNGAPLFAVGEEKTNVRMPPGYGWLYRTTDRWVMNHMIHNLTPARERVYITYEMDFLPLTDPAAAGMKQVQTLWGDVMGGTAYPVFDAVKGTGGHDHELTYPNEQPALRGRRYALNRYVVQQDGALVATNGHLHPGGLYTELWLNRGGHRVKLFRSQAHYWEPAGPVSWDMAMTVTPPSWRVQVRRGDVLEVTVTYDTRRASWYESMGIMPMAFSPGDTTGADPFTTNVDVPGVLTHGRLPENSNHGGEFSGLPDPRRVLSIAPPPGGRLSISGFLTSRGDINQTGRRARIPTVRQGRSLTFVNRDASKNIFHTITACKAPCNRMTGVAYPLADGHVVFDSGELGRGPFGFTPAANRVTWKTPKNLKPGTYTYFCRVHPFMRGAFRIAKRH
jgi:plastocyanin